jgi:hypothetical protein
LDLVLVGLDACYKQVANNCADRYYQGCTHVDEEFGRTMADEKLGTASQHQIKRLLGRSTEVFARDCHHNIGILCQESDNSFETGDKTSSTLD